MSERKALCPNCGAEIVFLWAGAIQTTCPACKSILVRHDVDLTKVGQQTEVPPSTSRLKIGSSGRFKGTPFHVVGRIVYRYGRGHWSEWHIRLGTESAWLSDANGEYVITKQTPTGNWEPKPDLVAGDTLSFGKERLTVSTVTVAQYAGVEGELPFEYWDKSESTFVDFRYGNGGFATLDFSDDPPLFFLGEYESFEELKLTGLRDPDADDRAPTKTRGVNCVSCGAAIELRLGDQTMTVACVACGTIMDATSLDGRMIEAARQEHALAPLIPLGSQATLKGTTFTAIGFQRRAIMVEGVEYSWAEYLLWHPDQGFRYLSEYEGHWNEITVIKGAPTQQKAGDHPVMRYLDRDFKHFQSATAVTRVALGEFPWEVRVGDAVQTDDYISPPLMLSREKTKEEVTWSLGTYTDSERIRQAFKLKDPLPRPTGVFANQPNPIEGKAGSMFALFLLFLVLLVGAMIWRGATAGNERVFYEAYEDNPRVQPYVTPVFELKNGTKNVEIGIHTDLANDWAFFNVALLQETGGRGYEIAREVSYYFGRDSDGSWSEGSKSDRAMIAGVPEGRYYLRVALDRSGSGRPFRYSVEVRRDVARVWPFLFGILALLVPPFFMWVREKSFETTRWSESDYAPEEEEEE